MNERKFRTGLADALLDAPLLFTHERAGIDLIDAIVALVRQHDGHAEFVRKIRARAMQISFADSIVDMCDAELAKEQS